MSFLERVEAKLLPVILGGTTGKTASLFRIAVGTLASWQAVGIALNLERYWGPSGMVPFRVVSTGTYAPLSLLYWAPESSALLVAVAVLFGLASLSLLLGWQARAAALLLTYLHISLQIRNPFILNSGDRLFAIILMLSALMPLSRHFSVDGWLSRRREQPLAPSTVWGQRMVGFQIGYVYLATAFEKLANVRWRDGTAMRDVLASAHAEWPVVVDWKPLLWALTYGTLLFELSFPFLIWWRRARPVLLVGGILFHLSIDALMVIPIFSYIMIVAYIVYLTDEETDWLLAQAGRMARVFKRS